MVTPKNSDVFPNVPPPLPGRALTHMRVGSGQRTLLRRLRSRDSNDVDASPSSSPASRGAGKPTHRKTRSENRVMDAVRRAKGIRDTDEPRAPSDPRLEAWYRAERARISEAGAHPPPDAQEGQGMYVTKVAVPADPAVAKDPHVQQAELEAVNVPPGHSGPVPDVPGGLHVTEVAVPAGDYGGVDEPGLPLASGGQTEEYKPMEQPEPAPTNMTGGAHGADDAGQRISAAPAEDHAYAASTAAPEAATGTTAAGAAAVVASGASAPTSGTALSSAPGSAPGGASSQFAAEWLLGPYVLLFDDPAHSTGTAKKPIADSYDDWALERIRKHSRAAVGGAANNVPPEESATAVYGRLVAPQPADGAPGPITLSAYRSWLHGVSAGTVHVHEFAARIDREEADVETLAAAGVAKHVTPPIVQERNARVFPPGRRALVAATLSRIIAEMTSWTSIEDSDLLLDMLLAYRNYITAERLLELLQDRFEWAARRLGDPEACNYARSVLWNTYTAVRYWLVTYYASDFAPNAALCERLAAWRTEPLASGAAAHDGGTGASVTRPDELVADLQLLLRSCQQDAQAAEQATPAPATAPAPASAPAQTDAPDAEPITSPQTPPPSDAPTQTSAFSPIAPTSPAKEPRLRPSRSMPSLWKSATSKLNTLKPEPRRSRQRTRRGERTHPPPTSPATEDVFSSPSTLAPPAPIGDDPTDMANTSIESAPPHEAQNTGRRLLPFSRLRSPPKRTAPPAETSRTDAQPVPHGGVDDTSAERYTRTNETETLLQLERALADSTAAHVATPPPLMAPAAPAGVPGRPDAPFLALRPGDAAQVLTAIETRLFQRVSWVEVMEILWDQHHVRPDLWGTIYALFANEQLGDWHNPQTGSEAARLASSAVHVLIARFNIASSWVASQIIAAGNLAERRAQVEQWITVAWECYLRANFASVCQILFALQLPQIARLERTWNAVGMWEHRVFTALCQLASPRDHFAHLRRAMLARVSRGSASPGFVPFFGIFVADLGANDALTPYVDPALAPSMTPFYDDNDLSQSWDSLINVYRLRTKAMIVRDLIVCQHALQPVLVDEDSAFYRDALRLTTMSQSEFLRAAELAD